MKNIVFIVNLPESKKQGRNAPYHYSVKSWEKWCDKNNHLLFVLDQRIHEEDFMNANWHKIYALELLDANEIDYDQVLIADADTIIHPNAPNIFSLTDNKFCAVHGFGSYDWICRSIENYKKYVFPNVDVDLFDYFNSGIIVCNRTHKDFYSKVISFYNQNHELLRDMQEKFSVGTDQPVLNFMVQSENVDYKQLGYEWNMQDLKRFELLDEELTFTKVGWIYHFNGIDDNIRNYIMEKTARTIL
jgi:hypothetical protein